MNPNFSQRTEKQKEFLKEHISTPLIGQDQFSKEERKLLQSIYTQPIEEGHVDKAVSKHQIRFAKGTLREELEEFVAEKFSVLLGDYTIDRIFGSTSESPTQIHTDSTNVETDLPPHKNIMIPISVNGSTEYNQDWKQCQTIYFHQVWLERCGKSLFKKGYRSDNAREDIEVYDYDKLLNISNNPFPVQFYMKYLTHIPYAHCENLSPVLTAQWKPNSAVIFDRNRLHTANNYIIKGVKQKRFVCIFTNHATSGN